MKASRMLRMSSISELIVQFNHQDPWSMYAMDEDPKLQKFAVANFQP